MFETSFPNILRSTPVTLIIGLATFAINLPIFINVGKAEITIAPTPAIKLPIKKPTNPPPPFVFFGSSFMLISSSFLFFFFSSSSSLSFLLLFCIICLSIPALTLDKTSFSFSIESIFTRSVLITIKFVIAAGDKLDFVDLFGINLFVSNII